ncbi:MAG TPA: LysE family translocator [Geobacteraceae bacterium]|nr:LysE family translocator [Geobacteraceae bacterium]
MTASTLLCFLGASVALTIAPGPDNTFVVAQGISRGRKAAVTTALGMCSGISVHTTAAALGISALLYSSAVAFMALKYAGAAYLLFLAYRALKEGGCTISGPAGDKCGSWILFRRGFVMNVVNPKVALFFLAFLPQFVTPQSGGAALQMFLLGLAFMLQAVVVFTAIGLLSGSIGNAILKKPRIAGSFSWLTAGIFALLGIRLALADK